MGNCQSAKVISQSIATTRRISDQVKIDGINKEGPANLQLVQIQTYSIKGSAVGPHIFAVNIIKSKQDEQKQQEVESQDNFVPERRNKDRSKSSMFLGGRLAELVIHTQQPSKEKIFESPQSRGKGLRREGVQPFKTVIQKDSRQKLASIDERSPTSPAHYQTKQEYIQQSNKQKRLNSNQIQLGSVKFSTKLAGVNDTRATENVGVTEHYLPSPAQNRGEIKQEPKILKSLCLPFASNIQLLDRSQPLTDEYMMINQIEQNQHLNPPVTSIENFSSIKSVQLNGCDRRCLQH